MSSLENGSPSSSSSSSSSSPTSPPPSASHPSHPRVQPPLPTGVYQDPEHPHIFYKYHRSRYTYLACAFFFILIILEIVIIDISASEPGFMLRLSSYILPMFCLAPLFAFYKFKWCKIVFNIEENCLRFVTASFPLILCHDPMDTSDSWAIGPVPLATVMKGARFGVQLQVAVGGYSSQKDLRSVLTSDPSLADDTRWYLILGSSAVCQRSLNEVFSSWEAWLQWFYVTAERIKKKRQHARNARKTRHSSPASSVPATTRKERESLTESLLSPSSSDAPVIDNAENDDDEEEEMTSVVVPVPALGSENENQEITKKDDADTTTCKEEEATENLYQPPSVNPEA